MCIAAISLLRRAARETNKNVSECSRYIKKIRNREMLQHSRDVFVSSDRQQRRYRFSRFERKYATIIPLLIKWREAFMCENVPWLKKTLAFNKKKRTTHSKKKHPKLRVSYIVFSIFVRITMFFTMQRCNLEEIIFSMVSIANIIFCSYFKFFFMYIKINFVNEFFLIRKEFLVVYLF